MSFTYLDDQPQSSSGKFIYLDDSKPAQDSVMARGIGGLATYPEEHPIKTLLQPIAKTLTGKSLEDMADEHTQSEPFTRPPSDAPFDRNLQYINPKASLEVGAAQNADLITQPINAAAGPIVKAAAELFGLGEKAIAGVPQAMRDTSGWLYNQMSKAPDKAYRYGKDPLAVMAKEKVTANSTPDLVNAYQDRLNLRNQQLQDAVSSSDKTIDAKDTIGSHLDDASAKLSKNLELEPGTEHPDMAKLDNIKSNLEAQYGDLGQLSVKDAVRLKRQLADEYPFSKENETDPKAVAAHKIYHDLNSAIELAHPEIADLNERVSSLIDIQAATRKRMAIEARNNPLGLINSLLGIGTGAAVGHGAEGFVAGASTAIMAKMAQSPMVLTRVAKTLSNMADVDKMQLFKASPEFMGLAAKAMNYAKNAGENIMQGGESLGMAGKSGSNAKIPPQVPLGDSELKAAEKSINAQKYAEANPDLAELWHRTGGTQIGNEGGIVSIGDDLRKVPKEELQESLKYYDNLARYHMGGHDRSNFRDAMTMVNKIKNAINDVGKSPIGLTAATGAVGAAALGAKNANAAKSKINDDDAIKTIIGEGESIGFQGMRALASAIRNRGTLQGAYGLNAPRVVNRQYSPKTERLARQAWEDSQKKDFSGGANHWFSDADLKKPAVKKMIQGMQKLGYYRGNTFYKEGKAK